MDQAMRAVTPPAQPDATAATTDASWRITRLEGSDKCTEKTEGRVCVQWHSEARGRRVKAGAPGHAHGGRREGGTVVDDSTGGAGGCPAQ